MKNFFLCLFFCFSLVAVSDDVDPWDNPAFDDGILLASDAEKFAYVKANISSQLDTVSSNVTAEASRINEVETRLRSEIQSMYDSAMNHPNEPYYQGMRAAANRFSDAMYDLPFGEVKLNEIQRSLNNAQQWLNRINFVPGSGDYTNVLNFIATNQWYFADTATNQLMNVISNLTTIAIQVEDVFPDLHQMLVTILPDLADTWVDIVEFFAWATDVEDTFRKFFDLAYERLEKPDDYLSASLYTAWLQCMQHYNEIISGPIRPLEGQSGHWVPYKPLQLLQQHINSGNINLSNEGWLLAESLQVGTFSYFVQTEILNALKNLTNSDSSAGEDFDILQWRNKMLFCSAGMYTNLIYHQQRLYDLFNRTIDVSGPRNAIPYLPNEYKSFTNFVTVALTANNLSNIREARYGYTSGATNWFNRIESLLLYQNGLMPIDFDRADTSKFEEENLDEENIQRRLLYSTNSLKDIIVAVGGVSNKLTAVLNSYKEFTQAFTLPTGHGGDSGGGGILMIPELTMGSVTFNLSGLTWDDLQDIADPIRVVSQLVWYVVFGFLSFKLVIVAVYLFGRVVSHIVLVVSTLLS